MSDVTRVTGINTGWDTDNMIKELMNIEQIKSGSC